jgi:hypothetical protein
MIDRESSHKRFYKTVFGEKPGGKVRTRVEKEENACAGNSNIKIFFSGAGGSGFQNSINNLLMLLI